MTPRDYGMWVTGYIAARNGKLTRGDVRRFISLFETVKPSGQWVDLPLMAASCAATMTAFSLGKATRAAWRKKRLEKKNTQAH